MTCHLYNQIKFLSVYLEALFFQKYVFFSMILSYRTLEQHEGISFSVLNIVQRARHGPGAEPIPRHQSCIHCNSALLACLGHDTRRF